MSSPVPVAAPVSQSNKVTSWETMVQYRQASHRTSLSLGTCWLKYILIVLRDCSSLRGTVSLLLRESFWSKGARWLKTMMVTSMRYSQLIRRSSLHRPSNELHLEGCPSTSSPVCWYISDSECFQRPQQPPIGVYLSYGFISGQPTTTSINLLTTTTVYGVPGLSHIRMYVCGCCCI